MYKCRLREVRRVKWGKKEEEKNALRTDEGKTTTQIYAELRDGVRKDKEMGPNPRKQLPAIPGNAEKKQTV